MEILIVFLVLGGIAVLAIIVATIIIGRQEDNELVIPTEDTPWHSHFQE